MTYGGDLGFCARLALFVYVLSTTTASLQNAEISTAYKKKTVDRRCTHLISLLSIILCRALHNRLTLRNTGQWDKK